MGISCCNGCVAPKRYPGCHGSSPEYIEEKAKNDAQREEDNKRRRINYDLNAHRRRYAAIARAVNNQRKYKEE